MATTKSKCSQTGDLNLQEGAIFSRSLNDNRRMIMTGLYFIRFYGQNVCLNNLYSKTTQIWTELISGKDEPKPNREFNSEPRVTDISVNRANAAKHRMLAKHADLYKLRPRVSEHMGFSTYTEKELSRSALLSILAHKRKTGHDVSLDDFSILSGSTQFDVLLRESMLISKLRPSLKFLSTCHFLFMCQLFKSLSSVYIFYHSDDVACINETFIELEKLIILCYGFG